MNENTARHEICRVGRSLYERGYVHATAGNISVLLGEDEGGGFLITPTDACLGYLEPHRLARLDANGKQLSGDRASKTIELHRQIYQASNATAAPARCVVHTHSTHCVALTLLEPLEASPSRASGERELLPALTPYFVMKVGHVPWVEYARPGDSTTATRVTDAIEQYAQNGTPIRAVMLDRLGPNVWHETPANAMATLEELEETARLWQLAGRRATPLTESQIDSLRTTFGVHW